MPGADFDDRIAILVFVRRQERDLEIALEIGDAFLQIGNFILGHGGDLDVVRCRQLAVVVELLARRLQLGPAREQLLHAGMLPHDVAGAFPVLEQRGIGDLAFELLETLPLAFD